MKDPIYYISAVKYEADKKKILYAVVHCLVNANMTGVLKANHLIRLPPGMIVSRDEIVKAILHGQAIATISMNLSNFSFDVENSVYLISTDGSENYVNTSNEGSQDDLGNITEL